MYIFDTVCCRSTILYAFIAALEIISAGLSSFRLKSVNHVLFYIIGRWATLMGWGANTSEFVMRGHSKTF